MAWRTSFAAIAIAMAGCATLQKHVNKANVDIIREGIACAHRYWGHTGLVRVPDVETVTVGQDPISCGPHGAHATGCWDPTARSIYIVSGTRPRAAIVGTMAHEWSHAIWQPLSRFDPTHGVDWEAECS